MDITGKIKKELILKIENSDDLEFLVALRNLLNSQAPLYQLTLDQLNSINKGRNDFQKGKYRSNEKVMEELQEWLKK